MLRLIPVFSGSLPVRAQYTLVLVMTIYNSFGNVHAGFSILRRHLENDDCVTERKQNKRKSQNGNRTAIFDRTTEETFAGATFWRLVCEEVAMFRPPSI